MSKTDLLIKESFILMDRDSDGCLLPEEMNYALKFIGVISDDPSLGNLNARYSMEDFKKIAKKELGSLTPQDHFKKAVQKLDKNGSGVLSVDMTTHLVFTMSDVLSSEDISIFTSYIDPENTGKITIEDLANKVFA